MDIGQGLIDEQRQSERDQRIQEWKVQNEQTRFNNEQALAQDRRTHDQDMNQQRFNQSQQLEQARSDNNRANTRLAQRLQNEAAAGKIKKQVTDKNGLLWNVDNYGNMTPANQPDQELAGPRREGMQGKPLMRPGPQIEMPMKKDESGAFTQADAQKGYMKYMQEHDPANGPAMTQQQWMQQMGFGAKPEDIRSNKSAYIQDLRNQGIPDSEIQKRVAKNFGGGQGQMARGNNPEAPPAPAPQKKSYGRLGDITNTIGDLENEADGLRMFKSGVVDSWIEQGWDVTTWLDQLAGSVGAKDAQEIRAKIKSLTGK
jgi:hypothetical protein